MKEKAQPLKIINALFLEPHIRFFFLFIPGIADDKSGMVDIRVYDIIRTLCLNLFSIILNVQSVVKSFLYQLVMCRFNCSPITSLF